LAPPCRRSRVRVGAKHCALHAARAQPEQAPNGAHGLIRCRLNTSFPDNPPMMKIAPKMMLITPRISLPPMKPSASDGDDNPK
jgi:hypothetical protein